MQIRTIVAAFAATTAAASAQINPPAGPVTDSGPNLSQVIDALEEARTEINAENTPGDASSVFRISQPGSYYLAGNVLADKANFSAIEVAATDVTIDLNGFAIDGAGLATGGIRAFGPTDRLAIRNGVIKGINGNMISAGSPSTSVRDIRAVGVAAGMGADGIFVGGAGAIVERCVVEDAGADGIDVGEGGVVRDSAVINCGSSGITLQIEAIAERCSVTGAADGILMGGRAKALHCRITGSRTNGIRAFDLAFIEGCTIDNATFDGIQATGDCVIVNNQVRASGDDGIVFTSACRVEGNLVIGSTTDGIRGSSRNSIVNNTVEDIGDDGFQITGPDNRVDSNTAVGCTIGFRTQGIGVLDNMIVRNFASDCAITYSVLGGNFFSFTGPSASSSTNPWINIAQ
ncbi:MAG: right-handed parallel beta-helix repeat-containing protein [Planctomycetota bacterium]